MTNSHTLWTIDELGAQVALALAVDYNGTPSGRVRDVPDLRTIRYYTTLGLLDRLAEMRGRTALYGRRHLLQVVAIKRLQAKGLALAAVQDRLLGLTDAALARLASVPADGTKQQAGQAAPRDFWKEGPAAFVSREADAPSPTGETAASPAPSATVETAAARPYVAASLLPLADDVSLLLQGARALDPDDIQAIRTVAAPLLKLLDQRRLRGRAEKGNTHDQTTTRAE